MNGFYEKKEKNARRNRLKTFLHVWLQVFPLDSCFLQINLSYSVQIPSFSRKCFDILQNMAHFAII